MLKLSFLFFLLSSLNGCSSSQRIAQKMEVTPNSSILCDSTRVLTQFFSYYEGEKIEFAYEPLDLFRTISNANSDPVAIELLKILAAKRCADGIINISQTQFKEEAKSKVSMQPVDINSALIASNKFPQYTYVVKSTFIDGSSKQYTGILNLLR